MPWTFLHGTSDDPDAELARAKLRKAEEEAAAVLGFPAAHIHVESDCLELYDPIWLESVRVTTGNREHGGHASGRAWRRGETTRKKVLEILATTAQSLSNQPSQDGSVEIGIWHW